VVYGDIRKLCAELKKLVMLRGLLIGLDEVEDEARHVGGLGVHLSTP
jgi:hypothetical protein